MAWQMWISFKANYSLKIFSNAVWATLSSARDAESSRRIQSINIGTKYRSGNTTHLAGESKGKKG
jgi:hypothetical protein